MPSAHVCRRLKAQVVLPTIPCGIGAHSASIPYGIGAHSSESKNVEINLKVLQSTGFFRDNKAVTTTLALKVFVEGAIACAAYASLFPDSKDVTDALALIVFEGAGAVFKRDAFKIFCFAAALKHGLAQQLGLLNQQPWMTIWNNNQNGT